MMQRYVSGWKFRKGFYFSFDAILALSVMAASLFVVMQSSDLATDSYRSETLSYQQSGVEGRDAMKLAASQRFDSVFNESFKGNLTKDTNFTDSDLDRTVLDGITLLWAQDTDESRKYARTAIETYFGSKVSDDYDYRLQVGGSGSKNVLYETSSSDNATTVSSASRPVSGHRIGRSSEGFQARVGLSEISKPETETVYFGGYIGDGNITYNVTLPDLDTVLDVSMEGHFSGPFRLVFNGEDAGRYDPSNDGNLSSDTFQVCTNETNQNRCGNLSSGDNLIELNFEPRNQSNVVGGSIGGGFMEITYNRTTGLNPEQNMYNQKTKQISGIDGVINYYDGFYVPGQIHGIQGEVNYQVDNQTFFIKMGNATVYEERTIGDSTASIDNQTVFSNITDNNMSYSSMSRRTVPLRMGLKNIDEVYSRAIADVALVDDSSGSMAGDKMQNAKEASKTFTEIILNASGNRAGVVDYDSEVVDTHLLSENQESLNGFIDGMNAEGGTCIACGILGGIENLQDPYVENIVSRESDWHYTTDSENPDIDDGWNQVGHNTSDWEESSAIIGSSPEASTITEDYNNYIYLRKRFYLTHNGYENITLGIRSDDAATVYLNGQLIDNDTSEHAGEYWNRKSGDELSMIDRSVLESGWNSLAVKLKEENDDTRHLVVNATEEWDEGDHNNTEVVKNKLVSEATLSGEAGDVEASQYSSVSGSTNYNEWIERVRFNQIDRVTGDNSGYLDATDSATEAVPGETYEIQVTFNTGGYEEYATVAFDWDGDGDISEESVERIGSCSSNGCTVSTEITVPDNATLGNTLMRVMGEYSSYHTNAGESPSYNEVEDYTVFIPDRIYSNGTYTSELFETGKPMNWQDVSMDYETPSGTNIEVDFSDGTAWYDTIADMPESQEMQYNVSLTTTDEKVTPRINVMNITYEGLVTEFDAALNATQQKRRRFITVMSDGEPSPGADGGIQDTGNCNKDGVSSDSDAEAATIEAAYRAHENHNITVHTVGFGDSAAHDLLNDTARCGGGEYYHSDTSELESVFRNISNNILNASYTGQTLEAGDESAFGQLYSDSYLKFNYSTDKSREYGEFSLKQVSDRFGGTTSSPENGSFTIPENTEVESARITSYSGDRWTDRASIKNEGDVFEQFYNLSNYDNEYQDLGDPFVINIPTNEVQEGENIVSVNTALNQSEPQGWSPDNRIHYTLRVNGSVGYGALNDTREGARSEARRRLEEKLEGYGLDVEVTDENSDVSYATKQPYIWGPKLVKLVVWK